MDLLNGNLLLANGWFGEGASNMVDNVDWLYNLITNTGAVVFVGLHVLAIYFLWKYRMRVGHATEDSPSHNDPLEIAWTVIPMLIFAAFFYFGFRGFIDMRTPPDDAYEIHVTASKWNWRFRYPNGLASGQLHVPIDRPVKLIQESSDVLHSLYIPAFRIKQDVVPGRYTYQWFTATKEGTYDLFCAEYCGTDHSNMYAPVIVESQEKFEEFLATDPRKDKPDHTAGYEVYIEFGCKSCHSLDGTEKAGGGPSFKGSWGTQRELQDGTTVLMDENYIRESLLQPAAKIHKGFEPRMPTFQGQINDDDIRRVIAFIKDPRIPDPEPAQQ